MAYHKQPLAKTHDLLKLLEMCCSIATEFSELSMDAAVLGPFATEFRYPIDDEVTPERKVVLDAIERARKVLQFVEKRIQ